MRRSKAISAFALLASAALVLGACGGGGSGEAGSGEQDLKPREIGADDEVFNRPEISDSGEFVFATEETFGDYNNNVSATNNFANTEVANQLQPSPFYYDQDDSGTVTQKLDGDVMESVVVTSTDPVVIEWKVRSEAVWSDGEALDCDDFYLHWLAGASKKTKTDDEGNESSVWDTSPTGYEDISKVECSEDGKTVTTTFGQAFADYRALFQYMMPAHVLERDAGVADITKITDDSPEIDAAAKFYTEGWLGYQADRALSAGPFILESVELRERVVLVRNPKWWAKPAGPSKITVIKNTDSQSMLQQIQNKEVDLASPQGESALAIAARGDSSLQVYANSGLLYEHIDFNMARPIFKFDEVRKAIATCVPGQTLVDTLVADVDPNAKPLSSLLFMPTEKGYEEHYTDVAKGDAAAAKKILTDAGWTQGADGIFAKDDQRASFKLGHKIVTRRADTVRLVQAACREAGIEVVDEQKETFNDKELPASEFDAALFAWVGVPIKSSSYGNYACKEAGGAANYNNYCNAEFDKIYKEANAELDFDKRTELLNKADKMMAEDLHSVPLFVLPDFAIAQKGVGPLHYVGAQGGVMANAFAWQRS